MKFTKTVFYSILVSVLYGLLAQAIARSDAFREVFLVMSIGFVFVFPISLGFFTVYTAPSEKQKSFLYQLFAPWGVSFLSMFLAMLIGWEGTICLVLALPIYLICSSIGGVIAGIWVKVFQKSNPVFFTLGLFGLAPFLIGFLESPFPLPTENREVLTSITIQSTPEVVWKNITRIPKITEKQEGFFYFMGFPRPVEATLSHDGIGGVRDAVFEKGLVFYETINIWKENKKLGFKIRVDPNSTPITTLDSHVTVGGRYFDALYGEYEIEPLNENSLVLHLKSEYRLSTRFNVYAGIWSDYLMRDIQENILRVLKFRIESKNNQ